LQSDFIPSRSSTFLVKFHYLWFLGLSFRLGSLCDFGVSHCK
jgi:hypothetical protein